jgi:hypothetical protein
LSKFKKLVSSLVITAAALSAVNYISANAAVKGTSVPKIKFSSQPKTEYKAGDIVNFNLYAPEYKGKVQYRVVLWNDETKSYRDLWTTGDRYYKNWQPYGKEIFNLHWGISEPGHYRITIYAKRAGIPNNKTALKGYNCDSYMEGVAFVVKPKETVLSTPNKTYGSDTAANPLKFAEDVKITGELINYKNANLDKNLYISADQVSLSNINVKGTIFINPGKEGTADLSNVTAKNIEILSGSSEYSTAFSNVRADTLAMNYQGGAIAEAGMGTIFKNTIINADSYLYTSGGSFGNVEVRKSTDERYVALEGKFYDPITVKTNALVTSIENSQISKVIIKPEYKEDEEEMMGVAFEGIFDTVELVEEAAIALQDNSRISNLNASSSGYVYIGKGSLIGKINKNNNRVYIEGEGQVGEISGSIAAAPKPEQVAGKASYEVGFGKDKYDNGQEFNALVISLKDADGNPLKLSPGIQYRVINTEVFSEDYKGGSFREDTLSLAVNEETGMLKSTPGNHTNYILVGDKYYTLNFTVDEEGRLTSVNGDHYNYVKWTPQLTANSNTN